MLGLEADANESVDDEDDVEIEDRNKGDNDDGDDSMNVKMCYGNKKQQL